jgi:ElaB/YqjD/DUF883 family membrane-anchored ribosome-binding protein
MVFQPLASKFDPRISAIAGHLRAIEKELGGVGKSTGRRAVASASSAGGQIAGALGPILNEVLERISRGQRVVVDHAAGFSDEAANVGARFGNDALKQFATQAKQRPMATLAVAIGVGLLIGFAVRRS